MEPPPIQYAITSDGYSIAYCVAGNGRPIILMPFPFNNLRRMWRQHTNLSLYEPLSQRARLIHYDSRGQGMSSRGVSADHSYDDYMFDLEALVERLQLDRFVLFAGLLSCHTAVRYAARHPSRVEALILTSVPLDNPVGGLANFEELASRSWDTAMRAFVGGNVRIGDQEGDAASVDYFRETITQPDFLRMVRAGRRSNVEDSLSSVRCPTLVVSSGRTLFEAEQRIAAAIPNARLVLVPRERLWSELYTNDGSVPPIVPAIDAFLESLNDRGTAISAAAPSRAQLPASLSPREWEVLRLVTQGKTNRQIAEELVITERTVINHLSHIFIKTGAENRAGATAYALRHGLA